MSFDRRQFFVFGAALVASGTLSLLPQAGFGQQTPRVRHNIASLSSKDPIVEALREAVSKMHELTASDEHSWTGQAHIHLDHCHRQRFHFLPWHRFYIWAFEQIVCELTGMTDWALPYWNWTDTSQMPSIFFGKDEPLDTRSWNDPDSQTGPDAHRIIGSTDTIPTTVVDIGNIMNQKTFAVFDNRLNRGPHGGVHVFVGGHMGRFLSPLDPVFWIHHCNVDRIWAHWNLTNSNPNNADWLNEDYDNMFVDPNGQPIVDVKTSDLLDTKKLGYMYDDLADRTADEPLGSAALDVSDLQAHFDTMGVGANNNIPSVVNIPTTIMVPATNEIRIQVSGVGEDSSISENEGREILARLSHITIPEDADNYVIRVFLNCSYLSPTVPSEDPHFVAEINLFGLRQMTGMSMKDSVILVNLTSTMLALHDIGTEIGETIDVQLMPVPIGDRAPTGAEFEVGRVDIVSVSYSRGVPKANQ